MTLGAMRRADFFMMATGYEGPLPNGDGYAGLDVSHRGGQPGFVRVDGPGTLRWPDYLGNLTFTTLGEPAAPQCCNISQLACSLSHATCSPI